MLCDRISKPTDDFLKQLTECKGYIRSRSLIELDYLSSEKKTIESLTREEAISELLKSKKLEERILSIKQFVRFMS